MSVPLLDLSALYHEQRDAIDDAIRRVVESQVFIGGPEVDGLEQDVAAYLEGRASAVACGSGSDAIILALRALEVGSGDEVIVPAQSFTSTATSVDVVGATPVFADVDGDTLNLTAAGVVRALTPRTKAVIAVHLFGLPADVPAIREALDAAGRSDVRIIEDSAQSLGARWAEQPACTLGDLATISFFPTKNLGAFGDAGMVVARDPDLAAHIRALRQHGAVTKYNAEFVGYNSRLDAIQAAILRVKLPALDGWCEARRANAARYRTLFGDAGLPDVRMPAEEPAGARHIYNQFNLRVADRDRLAAFLGERGIGTAVYYPRTLPQQPCYADLGHTDDAFPNATAAAADSLAIPVYPGLSAAAQREVVAAIAAFYAEGGE